jgi:hypothetical protein
MILQGRAVHPKKFIVVVLLLLALNTMNMYAQVTVLARKTSCANGLNLNHQCH